MPHHYQIDPEDVLGVARGASLQEIREAYRARATKHHPDHGGDAWAFRLVSWAYETMSTARVLARAASETASPAPAKPRPAPFRPPPARAADAERVREGVHDAAADPFNVVEVEVFAIRFAMDSPLDLFSSSPQDRNLSCCLNVAWPSREIPAPSAPAPVARRILADLGAAFAAMPAATRAIDSHSDVEGGRFSGWLSYPSVTAADEAFHVFHDALNARRLSVHQTTREVIIPRDRQ